MASVVLLGACNTEPAKKEVTLASFEDSASYAVGTTIGLNLKKDFESQGVDSAFDNSLLIAGLSDAVNNGETKMTDEDAQKLVSAFFERQTAKRAEKNGAAGEACLIENKGKPGVITTESGLQYIVLNAGEGAKPALTDQVVVHYTGKLLDGTVFDSSIERNEPVTFFVRAVIPGWTEALQLMSPGAEYKLFIPGEIAYGPNGGPRGSNIGPNEVLIFDVKLIDILKQ